MFSYASSPGLAFGMLRGWRVPVCVRLSDGVEASLLSSHGPVVPLCAMGAEGQFCNQESSEHSNKIGLEIPCFLGLQSPNLPTSWPPTLSKHTIAVFASSGHYGFLAKSTQSCGPWAKKIPPIHKVSCGGYFMDLKDILGLTEPLIPNVCS